jgi:hypothetical protein
MDLIELVTIAKDEVTVWTTQPLVERTARRLCEIVYDQLSPRERAAGAHVRVSELADRTQATCP